MEEIVIQAYGDKSNNKFLKYTAVKVGIKPKSLHIRLKKNLL